jgi:precorrin-8X/cobalt-precorrin-8 methylmutase
MSAASLTIKELTKAVGSGISPRMVRHYHQLGLLPQPMRSASNYRLYTQKDVIRLQHIVALKQQGFHLNHIRQILEVEPEADANAVLMKQLQQQYRVVIQQIAQLRQTASALEGLLGRDHHCQQMQAEVLSSLKILSAETQVEIDGLSSLWSGLDAKVDAHPEDFQESLERLLPDLSQHSAIEKELISQLVLACGDVSLAYEVRLGNNAIASAREALKSGCQVIADISTVAAALDNTRLVNLGCQVETLIDNPHITTAAEAEQEFWQYKKQHHRQHQKGQDKLQKISEGCILVVGYAPSVLLAICEAIIKQKIKPALVIAMPIGFSHAPAAKRQLMQLDVPFITIQGTLGGGLLAACALNSLLETLMDKPDCHCFLCHN